MPHKFNANRRGKIPKQKYRVSNWASYNESFRRRGDLTVWVSEEALGLWRAPRRATRGGQTFTRAALGQGSYLCVAASKDGWGG